MDTMNELLIEYIDTPAGQATFTRAIQEEIQRIANEYRPHHNNE